MKKKLSAKYVLILILILIIMYSLFQFSTNMDEGFTGFSNRDASGNSLCLGMEKNSENKIRNLHLWGCNPNGLGQQWSATTTWPDLKYFKLQNNANKDTCGNPLYCLNNDLIMTDCSNNPTQQWILPTAENPKFKTASNSNMCLTKTTNKKKPLSIKNFIDNYLNQNWFSK